MNAALVVAGTSCLLLALGHAVVGLRWVLPNLTTGELPSTPFGSASLTLGMVRFTWHILTVVLAGFSVLFLVLAAAEGTNPKTVLLSWFTAFWLAATATAVWHARRRPSDLLRLPVVALFVVIAAMCWLAVT